MEKNCDWKKGYKQKRNLLVSQMHNFDSKRIVQYGGHDK